MNKIISLVTPDIEVPAQCFIEHHRGYAAKHHYDYHCFTDKLWPDLAASFSKVPAIEQTMKEMQDGEILIWMDADICPMNYHVDLGDLLRNHPDRFMVGYRQHNWTSWAYICNGLLILRVGDDLRRYVAQWIDWCLNGCPNITPGERKPMLDRPWEQWSSDALVREWKYKGIHPATEFEVGCFCEQIWHDGVIWNQSMPTLHFGGPATWERRAEVFKSKYEYLVIK